MIIYVITKQIINNGTNWIKLSNYTCFLDFEQFLMNTKITKGVQKMLHQKIYFFQYMCY